MTPPKQPANHTGCTHAHHSLPLHTGQDCTAAISLVSPPECEQCLRVLLMVWNWEVVPMHSKLCKPLTQHQSDEARRKGLNMQPKTGRRNIYITQALPATLTSLSSTPPWHLQAAARKVIGIWVESSLTPCPCAKKFKFSLLTRQHLCML